MKLALNIFLSALVLGLCLWFVWPDAKQLDEIEAALRHIELATFWPYLAGYVGLLALTHFFRAWRWNNLLRPMGTSLPAGKLLAISSVGFMAILALPARLGEFVRPALLREKGKVSASAVLGTVAVERIVDGLMVSLLVFGCCFALFGFASPWWAYLSLAVFVAALLFLAFALRWPEPTVSLCVAMTLLPRLAPRLAVVLKEKLLNLISGFRVLKDRRNLALFVFWSALYWGANGMGMWVLARAPGIDLPLPVIGAFATMGVVAVGITLPNTPGLVGQFHAATAAGLSLYMANDLAMTRGLAYAIVLHGIQVVWYLGLGAIAMVAMRISFADMRDKHEDAGSPERQEAA